MGRPKPIALQPKRASDVFGNVRIRRAILAGKRGPTTPVPSWKLYENPSYDGIIAGTDTAGRQITISARKLAATLWELQELPLCSGPASLAKSKSSSRSRSGPVHGHRESVGSPKHLMLPPPSPTTPVPQQCVKPTSMKSTDSHRRSPYSDSATYHSRRASEETYAAETPRHSLEMEAQRQHQDVNQDRLKLEGVVNPTELLKVLSHIRGPDGQAPLAAVLGVELEHTRQRMRELETTNKAMHEELEMLMEERSEMRAKEVERFRAVVNGAKQESEEEKRLKRKAEILNKRLGQQLEQVKTALSKAVKELEKERKARQLMEDVCDELAREIGQDKAEVEQLKRESEKVREEIEEERRMLQMAEVWREERVQMKLAEARHELEEKNAVLDRLTSELEEFLRSKSSAGAQQEPTHSHTQDIQKATMLRNAVDSLCKSRVNNESSGEEDLHSIDLNKESLYDRTQGNRWTYNGEKGRRKTLRTRRRTRRHAQNAEHTEGNEQHGPIEDRERAYRRASIDTIPEQYELGTSGRRGKLDEDWEDSPKEDEHGFTLTPTLSPLLHSGPYPLSGVATPQRNSWSSGDLHWRRRTTDNSLRAKLLEAKMEEPPYNHRHRYHNKR